MAATAPPCFRPSAAPWLHLTQAQADEVCGLTFEQRKALAADPYTPAWVVAAACILPAPGTPDRVQRRTELYSRAIRNPNTTVESLDWLIQDQYEGAMVGRPLLGAHGRTLLQSETIALWGLMDPAWPMKLSAASLVSLCCCDYIINTQPELLVTAFLAGGDLAAQHKGARCSLKERIALVRPDLHKDLAACE